MARGISMIAEMGSGRHAETVTTVGKWRRGGEEALGNVAEIESSSEGALRNVAHKKEWRPEGRHSTIKS